MQWKLGFLEGTLGFYRGYIRDNRKENGNYYNIMGLFNAYIGSDRVIYLIMEKNMEATIMSYLGVILACLGGLI